MLTRALSHTHEEAHHARVAERTVMLSPPVTDVSAGSEKLVRLGFVCTRRASGHRRSGGGGREMKRGVGIPRERQMTNAR